MENGRKFRIGGSADISYDFVEGCEKTAVLSWAKGADGKRMLEEMISFAWAKMKEKNHDEMMPEFKEN